MTPVLTMENITKSYPMGDGTQPVLRGIDFTLYPGDFVSILGPSGAGKSTLMNILGCLDVPDGGRYLFGGRDICRMDEDALARVRNREIGFIFQSFCLLHNLTALENVELPLIYRGLARRERRTRAQELLNRVGLSSRIEYRPEQLSGGQQQRVAIARALACHPSLILADEPTGALDTATGEDIMELFLSLSKEGNTIVMITHNRELARLSRRVLTMVDGTLFEEGRP